MKESVRLCLPDKIDAVLGDTLEIFYKSVIIAANPSNYHISVIAPKGKRYLKKWLYLPTLGDTDFIMRLEVRNDFGDLVGAAETLIRIAEKPESPYRPVNILCVGDSLTAGGQWVCELRRRLCEIGGNPAGDGLDNIRFIGSCGFAPAQYEAYGGWTWNAFLRDKSASPNVWVYPDSGMKVDVSSQHSSWRDINNNEWIIETIDQSVGRLKMKPAGSCSLDQKMPAKGHLVWLSGGMETETTVYSAIQPEKGNPFWSSSLGRINFADYLQRNDIHGGIDLCYIMLGWNDYSQTPIKDGRIDLSAVFVAARHFIDLLHTEFPQCRIVIVSEIPAEPDGCGENYSCADLKWDWRWTMLGLASISDEYQKIVKTSDRTEYMDFVNVSCQYDVGTGSACAEKLPSQRATVKEMVCINGLHPAPAGYMMIADAIYRNIVAQLNQLQSKR